MKTCSLTILFVIALGLTACQPATPISPTASLPPESPTSTPTISVPTSTITPSPTVGPGGFPRRFHVEGNAFEDQFGQKMIFRGMSMLDPVRLVLEHKENQPDWNEHFFQVIASWGANIVRVPILPSTIRNYGMEKILPILDQSIAWAGENNMYVDIDFHSCGSIADNWGGDDPNQTTNMQEFVDFWDIISQRYANNDTVAFYELFNEPANLTPPPTKAMWLAWKAVAEQAISDIRTNDPNKIILVGGLDWAYNLSFVADSPIAFDNIGYTTHPYQEKMYLSWYNAFGKMSDKYAVFATEIGYQDNKPGYENTMVGNKLYSQAIVDYLEEHHISWTAWVFDDFWWTSLLIDDNFRPSSSGEYFRSRLLEGNFPGVPTTPLPTPLPTLPAPTSKPGNLAYGKPVTASSIETNEFPAENAVDGKSTTRWSSKFSDPQWIQVDLGAIYPINRVVLSWEASFGVAYKIQISSDGSNWETLYSTTTGDGGIDDLSVSGSGRYIRMYGTSRANLNGASYGYSLYEFEVYGLP